MKKNLVIIVAGGSGNRLRSQLPKQFLKLRGKTILQHTIEKFEHHPRIHDIFIVSHGDYLDETADIVRQSGYQKVRRILQGGATRQESARNGVNAASPDTHENLLIHDAARPFISAAIIDNILDTLNTHGALNVAVPSPDTIVEIDENNVIINVPNRSTLRRVQTPQAFKVNIIQNAHRLAMENNITHATDDCSLVLHFNLTPIHVVDGSEQNIKITYPQDLDIAEKILDQIEKTK